MSDKRAMVAVVWRDAMSEDPWKHSTEIEPSLATIVSVGTLIRESEETLTIGLNHDTTNDSFSCIMHIPLGWIVSRKELTFRRSRKEA